MRRKTCRRRCLCRRRPEYRGRRLRLPTQRTLGTIGGTSVASPLISSVFALAGGAGQRELPRADRSAKRANRAVRYTTSSPGQMENAPNPPAEAFQVAPPAKSQRAAPLKPSAWQDPAMTVPPGSGPPRESPPSSLQKGAGRPPEARARPAGAQALPAQAQLRPAGSWARQPQPGSSSGPPRAARLGHPSPATSGKPAPTLYGLSLTRSAIWHEHCPAANPPRCGSSSR